MAIASTDGYILILQIVKNKPYEGQRAIDYCISINAARLSINLFVAFPSKMNSIASNKTAISAIYERL